MTNELDIAVIGAGPAGATAALLLSRAGRCVRVFERQVFPRRKVCGGCLSSSGARLVAQIFGPGAPLTSVRAITFVRASGVRASVSVAGGAGLVDRAEFDAWLMDRTCAAGATVEYGVAASLERLGDGFDIHAGKQAWRARHILVAAGCGSLARAVSPAEADKRPMAGLQWTLDGTDRTNEWPEIGSIEMHWLVGGYVGLARLRAESLHVAAAFDEPARGRGPMLAGLRAANPAAPIWRIVHHEPDRPAGAAGFPWRPARLGAANAMLIGDAAGYAEPYSGEGMGQAMLSGALAARALLGAANAAEALRDYEAEMRRTHQRRLERCRMVGSVLRSRVAQRIDAWTQPASNLLIGRAIRTMHLG